MVNPLSFNAGGVGSIPGWGARIPHASWPKNQNLNNGRNIVVTLGSLYIGAQCCVFVLLENLRGMSCSGACWPFVWCLVSV